MRSARTMVVLALVIAALGGTSRAEAVCPAPLQVAPAPDPVEGDHTPPAAPSVERVDVTRWRVSVDATFAPDTAYVQIEIEDRSGPPLVLWTTPVALTLCPEQPLFVVSNHGLARATIRAVDRSGNRSETVVDATVEHTPRCRCGTGNVLVFLLLPVVGVGIAISLLVLALLRRRKLKAPALEVSPLVAEAIAREVLRTHLVVIAASVPAILGLSVAAYEGTAALLAIIAFSSLTRVMSARAMLRVLTSGAPAELRTTLLVAGRRQLSTSARQIMRAQRHAVPTSIVHRPPHDR